MGTNTHEPDDVAGITARRHRYDIRGATRRAAEAARRFIARASVGTGRWLARIAALLALLVALNMCFAWLFMGSDLDSQQRVARAQGILAQLKRVEATLETLESDEHTYVLTGDARDLQAYLAARIELDSQMRTLRTLDADDVSTQADMGELGRFIAADLDVERLAVDLRQAGRFDDAVRAVSSDASRRSTADVRRAFAQMYDARSRLLAKRLGEARAWQGAASIAFTVAVFFDLVFLGLIVYLVWREMAREREARRMVEAALAQRDQFLSLASHELRTPLTGMLTGAQVLRRRMLREGTLTPRDRRALEVLIEQGMRFRTLIEGMLDISRIEHGRLGLQPERLNLTSFARRVVEEAQLVEDEHTIEYTDVDEPIYVNADPMRLEQVLLNLLHNAMKYSPSGRRIWVNAERGGDEARLVVRDEGMGIPAEALPRIFERFYRAPNADVAHISGSGIGLFVVREVVAQHGGRVEVASVEGHGSTFTVVLPLAAPEAADEAAPMTDTLGKEG